MVEENSKFKYLTSASDSEKPEEATPDLKEVPDEADKDHEGSDLSLNLDSDSEFFALVSDEEKERLHHKNLLAIASPDSSLPSIRFTSEESLKIEQLLRLDRESMIAFGDTLRERNRVNFYSFRPSWRCFFLLPYLALALVRR